MNTLYTIAAAKPSASEGGEAQQADAKEHTTESTSHAEESQGIAALGIDAFAIGAQLLTFLVLFWVVKKFALDTIVRNLESRHKDINRGLKLAAEMDREKAQLDESVDKVLRKARKEADAILADARHESATIIKAAEQSASERADGIVKSAEGKIEREMASARAALKNEMAVLIAAATEAILHKKLDDKEDRALIDTYLKEATK